MPVKSEAGQFSDEKTSSNAAKSLTTGVMRIKVEQMRAMAARQDNSKDFKVPVATPPPYPVSGPIESFDTHGDLIMVAGLKPINFRVCAGSLAVASPAWRKAISQTRLRATAQQMRVCKILRLPDDNPDALRIILQVIHYKFDALPDTISCETLFHTVMLCQKHNIQRLLKPFWNK
jgi:hypothetical protein